MINNYNNPPGIVLLLSLLVLAALLTSSLTIATLVTREFSATSAADRGLAAYYAAESGLEQGLYLFRAEGRAANELSATNNLDSSKARWSRTAQGVGEETIPILKKDDTVQYDFIDPNTYLDSDLYDGANSKPSMVQLSFNRELSGPAWLESTSFNWSSDSIAVGKYFIPPSTPNIDLHNASIITKLRLRALYSDIYDLKVKFCTSTSCSTTFPLPRRLSLTSTGEKGDTKQTLSVTVSKYEPQAEVFDFTIFSECSILKGADVTSDVPCL